MYTGNNINKEHIQVLFGKLTLKTTSKSVDVGSYLLNELLLEFVTIFLE